MRRILRLFRRRALEREIAVDIAAHIEETADELTERGMDPAEALLAARAQFGNRTAVLEQSVAVWAFPPFETVLRDLRLAVRALRRAPVFTAAAVITLALGIGTNTAVFSLIEGVLLRPLPFSDPGRILVLWEHPPKSVVTASLGSRERQNPVSPQNFLDCHDRSHSFDAMAATITIQVGLSGFGEPLAVAGASATGEFFRVMGVRPLLGRTFDAIDDVPKGPRVAVLSHGLWRRQFGSDPSAVGRTVRILGEAHTIVGVMPEGFDLPFAHADLWTPMQLDRKTAPDQGRYLTVVARLKPGVSISSAQVELSGLAQRIAEERPKTNRDWGIGAIGLEEQITGKVSTGLWLLFGAVALVLLIAAGNVANLLLARGMQRQHEIALRTALGAGRIHIVTHLLAESLVLSVAGGLLGIALAIVALKAMSVPLESLALPRVEGVQVDARMLAFGFALSLVSTLLFGLAPAVGFSRTSPEGALKSGEARATHRGGRLREALVVVEVAMSIVLLAGASLLARSFVNQVSVSRGFRTDHILTMQMFFAPGRYYDDHRRAGYLDGILSRVRVLPGVEAASSANLLPMSGVVSGSGFRRMDRPEPPPGTQPTADFVIVSPQYFQVMGIPLLKGRDFDSHDTMSTEPAVIVNQAFADKFFPGENPIGTRLGLNWNVDSGVIIGLAANARQTSLTVQPQPTLFLAQAQGPMYYGALLVRTHIEPGALIRGVQDAVHAVDPDQAISDVQTFEQVVAQSVARPRFAMVLLGVFAGLALLLASVGLYGVLAYSVSQRTREIGIRMALGASASYLARGVVGNGLRLMLVGMAAGLTAALVLARILASLLYEVKPEDPITYVAIACLLLAVGTLAAWVPARRILAVDPAHSLRWE
jgi:putative ABC transport system permease protein